MENLRRKIVDFSKFTFNKKNIELSCNLNLQPSLLINFVQGVIMLSLKIFFKNKKIIKFLKFTYNN